MFYGGIGWTKNSYTVIIIDSSGAGRANLEIPVDEVAAERLGATLKRFADPDDGCLSCFVDSSNGALAEALVEAGLVVYRLDPPMLTAIPAHPHELASTGRDMFIELEALNTRDGFLRGRYDELARLWNSCEDLETELHASGRFLAHGDRSCPVVALTFDDGPHPQYTDHILRVLHDFGVPATFFCLGLQVRAHPDIVARTVAEGHCVANHSWSHPYLPDLSDQQLELQVRQTADVIETATGFKPTLFRPPYGMRTRRGLAMLNQLGQVTVMWDVDSLDWSRPGALSIAEQVLRESRSGSAILLHDGGGDRSQTAQALPSIIEGLLDRGQRLVTVEELMRARGAPAP